MDVHADLQLARAQDTRTISAYVRSDERRPLRWRLEVRTAGPGGTSAVSQSGTTTGESAAPVSVSAVNAPGSARLQVFDGQALVKEVELKLD